MPWSAADNVKRSASCLTIDSSAKSSIRSSSEAWPGPLSSDSEARGHGPRTEVLWAVLGASFLAVVGEMPEALRRRESFDSVGLPFETTGLAGCERSLTSGIGTRGQSAASRCLGDAHAEFWRISSYIPCLTRLISDMLLPVVSNVSRVGLLSTCGLDPGSAYLRYARQAGDKPILLLNRITRVRVAKSDARTCCQECSRST